MRNFTIYLRIDDASPEKVEVIKTAAMQAAKHLYTSALLVGGRRPPQIRLETDDLFMPAEEIMLADDIAS